MSGEAQNVFVLGRNRVTVESSEDGHHEIESTFKLVKRAKRKRISTTGTQLNNMPCSTVLIHNPVGNPTVYWGGIGDDAPSLGDYSGDIDGIAIYEGMYFPIPVDNANKIILVAEVENTEVQYVGLLNRPYDVRIDRDDLPELETDAPTVTSTDPTNTETNVERNKTIVITMSEPIDEFSVNTDTITISPVVTTARYLDPNDDTKIILKPADNLDPFTGYTITLLSGGVKDVNGNAIASQYVFTFTTKSDDPPADVTGPMITKGLIDKKALSFSLDNSDTTSGPTDVNISSEIIINFDEPLDADFADFILYDRSLSPITPIMIATSLEDGNSKARIKPLVAMKYSSLYSIHALGTTRDLAGNELASPNTSSQISFFTTEAETRQLIYNQVGTAWEVLGWHTKGRGLRVATTHINGFFNDAPKDVIVRVKKFGNFVSGESDTLTCEIRDKDLVLKATVGTWTGVTGITSDSEGQDIRFQNSAQMYQMQEDDVILIVYDDGDADDHLLIRVVEYNSNFHTNLVDWDTDRNALYNRESKELAATIFG